MPRIHHSLLATSALVALSSAAFADTFNTTSSSPVLVSTTSGADFFGSSANFSVSTGPAIEISRTGTSVISITTGGIISSSAATGTIVTRANSGLTAVTINNSGTIINTSAAGEAISSTATNAGGSAIDLTVRNAGTITGAINTAGGVDTIINTNGTINGNLSLGAGANVITINGGTVSGSITTAGGVDTLTMTSSSTVRGAVNLGDGDNVVSITDSSLNNDLTLGTGNDSMTVTNGTVSGSIAAGTGTDTLNISGTSFTTRGNITGLERLNVSATTLNIAHGITGVDTFRINSNSTVNVNNNMTLAAGSSILSSGTLRIGAGYTVSTATADFNRANLTFDVVSSSSTGYGKLVVGSAASGLGATSITLNLQNAGFIASGTVLAIVDGSATASAGSTLTNAATEGVHTFTLRRANTDQSLEVLVSRVSTSALVNSTAGDNIANVLDTLGTAVTGTLATVQKQISAQTTAAGVNTVVESLTPGIDGVGAASIGVTNATGGQISNRLASLRTGVATGDGMASRHLWLEGFGNMTEQEDRKGVKGYDANFSGATLGVDSDEFVEGMNTGVAFSYGQGNVDSNASHNASTDFTSYVGTLYGSRVMDSGVFVNGQVGLGMNQYETERTVIGVGKAKGETDGFQGTAKAEVGRDFAMDALTLTPIAGVQYTYLNLDGYTETGAGGANLVVDPDAMGAVDFTAGGKAAYNVALANGGTFRPNLRAGVTTRAGDTKLDTSSRFTGGGSSFKTPGIENDRTSFNAGAGLLLTTAEGVDLSADYDADIRSSLTGHTVKLKARWAF